MAGPLPPSLLSCLQPSSFLKQFFPTNETDRALLRCRGRRRGNNMDLVSQSSCDPGWFLLPSARDDDAGVLVRPKIVADRVYPDDDVIK